MIIGPCAAALKKDIATRCSGSGYVGFGTSSTFNFERTNSFSIYAWVKFTQTSVAIIIGREGNSGSGRGWSLSASNVGGSGTLRFRLSNTGGGANVLTVDTPGGHNDGKWHSVIVTYNGTSVPSGVHIYVDNVDQALTTVVNNLNATIQGSFTMAYGRDVNQGAFEFTGDCGGLAIFNAVVSSGDRAVLHNGRRPPNASAVGALSNLLGFWMMGDGAAYPTIPDLKSSNNGTMTSLSSTDLKLYGPVYY